MAAAGTMTLAAATMTSAAGMAAAAAAAPGGIERSRLSCKATDSEDVGAVDADASDALKTQEPVLRDAPSNARGRAHLLRLMPPIRNAPLPLATADSENHTHS